jgi:hypothetical protein
VFIVSECSVALFPGINDDLSLPHHLQAKYLESKRACEEASELFRNKEIETQERKREQKQQHQQQEYQLLHQQKQKKKGSELVEPATATVEQNNELSSVCDDCKTPKSVVNRKGAEVSICLFIYFLLLLPYFSVFPLLYVCCFC